MIYADGWLLAQVTCIRPNWFGAEVEWASEGLYRTHRMNVLGVVSSLWLHRYIFWARHDCTRHASANERLHVV